MYKPIQIPHVLNINFSNNIIYTENYVEELHHLLICFWEMKPYRKTTNNTIHNVIIMDGCIDLVVNFNKRQVGFSGMSTTDFHFIIELPSNFIGARLKPGAFYQLTGLPASKAMDSFIPISHVFNDFDEDAFFKCTMNDAKLYFENFLTHKIVALEAKSYVYLFDELIGNLPRSVEEFAKEWGYSKRHLQRVCQKYYALTPKMILSIIRFQKSLQILLTQKTKPSNVINVTNYYDQPHFNRDFKHNIGITPFELLQMYKD